MLSDNLLSAWVSTLYVCVCVCVYVCVFLCLLEGSECDWFIFHLSSHCWSLHLELFVSVTSSKWHYIFDTGGIKQNVFTSLFLFHTASVFCSTRVLRRMLYFASLHFFNSWRYWLLSKLRFNKQNMMIASVPLEALTQSEDCGPLVDCRGIVGECSLGCKTLFIVINSS